MTRSRAAATERKESACRAARPPVTADALCEEGAGLIAGSRDCATVDDGGVTGTADFGATLERRNQIREAAA
jgi:hypothetical protein